MHRSRRRDAAISRCSTSELAEGSNERASRICEPADEIVEAVRSDRQAAHDKAGSGNYSLIHNAGLAPGQQSDWRWCNKCQGLFFGGNPNPVCPAGGGHVKVGSGNYSLIHR